MGRGAYDTSDATNSRSLMAQVAINWHHALQANTKREAEVKQAAEDEAKLMRSKKSRGIMAAKRAAKMQGNGVAKQTGTEPAGNQEQATER